MTDGASPQLEDGHTRIANELMEALAAWVGPPRIYRIMLAVWRSTYGWQEKRRRVPRAELASIMKCSERLVRVMLSDAKDLNMITVEGRWIGVQKDWKAWSKPAAGSAALQTGSRLCRFEGNRQSPLPLSNRQGALPQKPAEPSATRRQRKKERTSTSKETPSSADDALAADCPDDRPLSERKPANTEKAQLVQELWEAFGFEGSPPSKKPAAYSGAIRLVDGKFAVARELITHLKQSPPKPEDGETPGAFFVATLKTMLAAPPGVGWRKAGTSWQTEVPKPPPEDEPNRLSFRR